MHDLVYDRTARDVTNDTPKGQYNWTDLNRVEAATEEIAGLLLSLGYSSGIEPAKTDWSRQDFPTASQMARFLENVRKVVEAYYTMPGAPELPVSMRQLTWQGANAIEQLLHDVEALLGYMIEQLRPAGTFYAGEV